MAFRSCIMLGLLVMCGSFAAVRGTDTAPSIAKVFQVSGTIELPYAGIVEPYQAWVDGSNDRSRIDSYGSLASVLYLGNIGHFGRMEEVVYASTEAFLNKRICLLEPGSKSGVIHMQAVTPNFTKFSHTGQIACGSYMCDMWSYSETTGDKENRYMFKGIQSGDTTTPVEFHFLGYDNLFGSHYDEYRVTYKDFQAMPSIPDSIFVSPINCSMSDVGFNAHAPGKPRRGLFDQLSHFQNADHIEEAFQLFQKKHAKQYKHEREHFERSRKYRSNHHFVESMNRKNLTYTLRLNHMADLSLEERRTMFGLLRTPGSLSPPDAELYKPDRQLSSIPSDFDWRLAGAVTAVKDQAICGSCWSFSTTGVIEGAHFLKTGELVELSQQNLMDCSWGEGNYACDGGEQYQAYRWILKHGGLNTARQYGAYLMQDGKCHFDNSSVGATISGFSRVKEGSESDLLTALSAHPVAVNIDASHDSFGFYGSGVYYEPKCMNKPAQLDHSVLAVGYGSLGGQDYWLVKNSWSVHWGNSGYVLMSRKDNNCGVASDASFVKMD